jgi:hypothetical protein
MLFAPLPEITPDALLDILDPLPFELAPSTPIASFVSSLATSPDPHGRIDTLDLPEMWWAI